MHVSIRSLSKQFGQLAALEDVSIEIEPGSLIGIIGPNGAGKTTLLRCLAGILGPTSGEILYDGERFNRERMDLRKRFGILADTPYVLTTMTPIQHIALVARLYERDITQDLDRVISLLRDLHMLSASDSYFVGLSRGETYKAALAALFTVDPELWLLDEPFASGMDPEGLQVLRREIHAATDRGRTVIFTTQLLELVEDFADSICVLGHGQMLGFGTLDQLRDQAGTTGSLTEVFAELRAGEQ